MSNIVAGITLGILCFPDLTAATNKIWGTVSFGYGGNYTTGGVAFGLLNLADTKTLNFPGILRCDVYDEAVAGATVYTFRYVPATDTLQIFGTPNSGATVGQTVELANGVGLPASLINDASVLFEATFNRTEMLG